MKTLSIDIETYSDQPLAKTGVYRYVESPVFEILLFSYSVDGGSVQQVDLACGEQIPAEVIAALEDDSVTKWAFNANFERICLSRFLGLPTWDYLKPDAWKCSMVWAVTMGLPLSLKGVGSVLGLEKQKLTEGKDLIKYFCQPCAPTKSNGQRPATFRLMPRTSGWLSKSITSEMWKPRCPSRLGLPNIPCRTAYGANTTSTRKSMTAVLLWIWNWCGKPFKWTADPAPNSPKQ